MERVGDIKLVKRLRKKTAPLTAAQSKLLDAAEGIQLDPDKVEAAFMARQLVQCTLPHSDPGPSKPVFTRRSGNLIMGIQPAIDTQTGEWLGYPYGTLPRLLLFWLITEAVRTKSRRIELGRSLSEFMRQLGLSPASAGAGKRGDAKRLREQMLRLFRCKISFDYPLEGPNGAKGHRWLDMQVANDGEYWWDHKEPEQSALWGSWLELGEKFYAMITAGSVPCDMRVLRALRRSPLALDLYAWLCHRVFMVNRSGQAAFIPWEGLMKQLGADYKNVDEFARYAKLGLRKISTVWRGLKFKPEKGGFRLYPSPLSLPPKLQLVTSKTTDA